MRSILRFLYSALILNLPEGAMVNVLNLICKILGTNTSFERTENGFTAVDEHLSLYVNFIFINRANLYMFGIEKRFRQLLDQYNIDLKCVPDNATFVDCGANIGEVGMALAYYRPDLRYVAFEPGHLEFQALTSNLNGYGRHYNCGLWNDNTNLVFYEKGDTADSSYIEIRDFTKRVTVPVVTLDSLELSSNDIYLKLEAEGAEPEVLEGANNTLDHIQMIYADCGFERGLNEETTLPSVANLLLSKNFQMISVSKARLVSVFRPKT